MTVMTRLEDCRVELMKQMDTYITDTIGDDEITEMWQVIGLPDGWDDDYLRELVWRADVWEDGLLKAYIETEELEDAIPIIKRAAEVLNVKIDL